MEMPKSDTVQKKPKSGTRKKHQLIIPLPKSAIFPARSEAGQLKDVCTLVVNSSGTFPPGESHEDTLVVAPGDELEIVLTSEEEHPGGSVWFFKQEIPLLLPDHAISRESMERVDLESGSRVFEVNHALAGASGESRYGLRATALGEYPMPMVGQGNPGTMIASKP